MRLLSCRRHGRPIALPLSCSQRFLRRSLSLSIPSVDSVCLMENPPLSSPIAFSGVDDPLLMPDTSSRAGSASGSFQGEALLSAPDGREAEFGFQRAEFGRETLVGTVLVYDRHVFLCYKSPDVWPSHVEAAESDRLPRLLSAQLKSKRGDMKKRTRFTVCEGEDGTETSNGDVLIFPDMIRYRKLTHFDVDNFVEEVLVKDTEWPPGAIDRLTGSYVFVCAHGSRDRRCGVSGPLLIGKFKQEIKLRCLQDQVSVSPCSHIGGHKYAGNVIIFSRSISGEVTGHWYGYVSPDDVPILLEQHIGKGEIVDHLWRGQMGLSEEDQKKAQNLRLDKSGGNLEEKSAKECTEAPEINGTSTEAQSGCCQDTENNSTCCQNIKPKDAPKSNHSSKNGISEAVQKKRNKEGKAGSNRSNSNSKTTWFSTWEREDTYAVLAVVAAFASVAVAYSCYRQLR